MATAADIYFPQSASFDKIRDISSIAEFERIGQIWTLDTMHWATKNGSRIFKKF